MQTLAQTMHLRGMDEVDDKALAIQFPRVVLLYIYRIPRVVEIV